jgi:orotate phosphoribosyltransferase
MQHEIAKALLDIGAVGFSPTDPVTFKSGIVSPVYVDNRRLIFHPRQWQTVILGFQKLIIEESIEFDVLAGIETAGIPHSSALAYMLSRPSVFVRKEVKEHGQKKRVEGGDVTGQRVLLVEDLVTTGGSSLGGVIALRDQGAQVKDCLAIISYGFPVAKQSFDTASVQLRTLTSFAAILDEAQKSGRFASEEMTLIADWLQDPYGWAERHGFWL